MTATQFRAVQTCGYHLKVQTTHAGIQCSISDVICTAVVYLHRGAEVMQCDATGLRQRRRPSYCSPWQAGQLLYEAPTE